MGTPSCTNYDPLSMTPNALTNSVFEEERKLCDELSETVNQLAVRLKPILKYITKPYGSQEHVLEVCSHESSGSSAILVLTREGDWGQIPKPSGDRDVQEKKVNVSTNAWVFYPFGSIIDGLKEAFQRAEEEREKRLASVQAARSKLEEVAAILKSTATPTPSM